MATIRKTPKQVQVDDTIYTFERAQLADAFEACVATVDAAHCLKDYPAVSQVPAASAELSAAPASDPGLSEG